MLLCHTDEGSVSYSDLRRNKEQKLTVTASTCNGEMVSKNFTFASRYSELYAPVMIPINWNTTIVR